MIPTTPVRPDFGLIQKNCQNYLKVENKILKLNTEVDSRNVTPLAN